MKKITALVLVVLMITLLTVSASATTYDEVVVHKAKTAPTIDGAVSTGEYDTVLTFDSAKTLWSSGDDTIARNYNATLYLAWDEEYLYTAFTAKTPTTGRTFANTDWSSNPPYIFERLSVMTAMTYCDPTSDAKFQPEDGIAWDWGKAYAASWAREWTISMQANGDQLTANHFGTVNTNPNFSYKVASANGVEIYEQRIPWAAINDGTNTVNATVGGKVGYAVAAVLEEVSGTDGLGLYFGNGVSGGKNFADYAILTLGAEKAADESQAEPDAGNPETGDSMIVFAVIALFAVAGAAVVVKVRR